MLIMKKYNKKAGDAYYYCFANAPPTASNSIIISPWKTLSPLLPPTITKDIGKYSLLLEYDMVPYSPTKRNRYIYFWWRRDYEYLHTGQSHCWRELLLDTAWGRVGEYRHSSTIYYILHLRHWYWLDTIIKLSHL